MRLLVTGGAGFIGSNFILYWLSHYPKDRVINLDKLTYAGNLDNLKAVENNPQYRFIKGDITDPSAVEAAIKEADIVINFAAETHVDRSIMDPAIFIKTNVLGTYVLLESAIRHKIKRFHHISTDEVYGTLSLDEEKKFTEGTPYAPRSPYAASKASSDHLVSAYFATYKLPITITNCSNNFGPFQYPEKMIALAITNIMENKKVPVYGDGLNVRDWLYVEDHCRAIDLVINKGNVGETYCVGGLTKDINNLTVVRKILGLMGKDETMIEFVKDRPGHDRKYALDWSKIKNQLGWEPKYDFDTYLKKTIDWYMENREWWKKLKNKDYEKYYKLQYE